MLTIRRIKRVIKIVVLIKGSILKIASKKVKKAVINIPNILDSAQPRSKNFPKRREVKGKLISPIKKTILHHLVILRMSGINKLGFIGMYSILIQSKLIW